MFNLKHETEKIFLKYHLKSEGLIRIEQMIENWCTILRIFILIHSNYFYMACFSYVTIYLLNGWIT